MKKYILSILTSAAVMTMVTSCDKDSEGLTGIVYYPAIALEGASFLDWQVGEPFVDPGYTATYMGEDFNSNVQVSTSMDENDPKPGLYTITYSATSPDGYNASATRSVWVTDPADAINGYYSVDPASYRLNSEGVTAVYGPIDGTIRVVGWGNGEYEVNDILGGFYWIRAGYGTSYAAWGKIKVAADGSISLTDSYVPGWGDSADDLTGTWDEATSTLSWDCQYAGMDFFVTLTKVE